jgi:hypothetical protein
MLLSILELRDLRYEAKEGVWRGENFVTPQVFQY